LNSKGRALLLAERNSNSGSRGARKRGFKPAKRSRETSVLLVRSSSGGASHSGYALGIKFFLFSFLVLFLFFFFLLGALLALLVILPAIVLAFGAALLLYVVFSLAGWAKPLIENRF
jgi:Flp pilus assembly protein TadB